MSESITVKGNDAARFAQCVAEGLPEGADLELVSKARATMGGKAAVLITFSVQTPDGTIARAQAVTTLAALGTAVDALRAMDAAAAGVATLGPVPSNPWRGTDPTEN